MCNKGCTRVLRIMSQISILLFYYIIPKCGGNHWYQTRNILIFENYIWIKRMWIVPKVRGAKFLTKWWWGGLGAQYIMDQVIRHCVVSTTKTSQLLRNVPQIDIHLTSMLVPEKFLCVDMNTVYNTHMWYGSHMNPT